MAELPIVTEPASIENSLVELDANWLEKGRIRTAPDVDIRAVRLPADGLVWRPIDWTNKFTFALEEVTSDPDLAPMWLNPPFFR